MKTEAMKDIYNPQFNYPQCVTMAHEMPPVGGFENGPPFLFFHKGLALVAAFELLFHFLRSS